MKTRIALLVLMSATVLAVASCDDDGVSPESFSLKVVVRDAAGVPVPGLAMSLAANIPFYGEKASPSKAAVAVPYTAARTCYLRIAVEDIEGNEVRELASDEVPAGQHRLVWNGTDSGDVRQTSGYYVVHSVAKELGTGAVLHEQRMPMYMAILATSRGGVGVTDDAGVIVLNDKRLFPYLYQVEDIPAVDETGQRMGTISFGASMRFHLADHVNGGSMKFFRDVEGPGTLNLVWDPAVGLAEEAAPVRRTGAKRNEPLPRSFELGQPYPVPFN